MTDPTQDPSLRSQKRAMRRAIRAKRAQQSDDERQRFSAAAAAALQQHASWQTARSVGLFYAMADEIDTRALIDDALAEGKIVALPVTPPLGSPLSFRRVERDTEWVRSDFGVIEPPPTAPTVSLASLDLIVVPCLAFDAAGRRLGYGGGYYDRTLPDAAPAVILAFECQQVAIVPSGETDRRVAAIVTERGWRPATVD